MAKWFYLTDGQPACPIEPAALKQLATTSRLKPTDKVRREDLADWYNAQQCSLNTNSRPTNCANGRTQAHGNGGD
jgi:hypothetical protein